MPDKEEKRVKVVAFVAMGLFWIFLILESQLDDLKITTTQKITIYMIVTASLVVGLLAILAIVFRKLPKVAGVTNFVVLFLVVVAFSLAPVIFLDENSRIIGLKVGSIIFLSLLPGWLYLQFVAVKGKTLWDEYVLNLYRLQVDAYTNLPSPPRGSYFDTLLGKETHGETVEPAENLYERKFRGLYGSGGNGVTPGEARRFQGENLFPVIIATLVLAIAWALVLKPEVLVGFSVIPDLGTVIELPEFSNDTLRFGFIGSYFYVVQMLMRRYYQDDLKSSAYINATVRVITVMLLVATLHVIWPNDWPGEIAFAFMIGVFPQVGLQALRSLIAVPLRSTVKTLKEKHPLSDLDGINVWYEARLLEEGIENLQNLATVNIVDIMLRTRIPVDRLVDWIDQAHLYLRVSKVDGSDDGAELSSRQKLRQFGIRSATDLENAFKIDDERKLEPPRWILNDESSGPSMTETILRTVADEPNLHHVRRWKEFSQELHDQLAAKVEEPR